ncbi:hypothetical protein KP79_PYT01804 [Mizuhopecten yessoensis]|uniref:CCHC-type domain-containing protein n=1 Tax=Mizuhopecten yessoensis TaxID=6573 RepID=A0A210Q5E1_MIZYE|nr:hypothetical protein KP79_PYT01804 [Mizuhopecten yessoensis]
MVSCYRCGGQFSTNHLISCPAKSCFCFSCGNIGHFSQVCFLRTRRGTTTICTKGSFPGTRQRPKSAQHPVPVHDSPDSESAALTTPVKKSKSSSKRRRDSERLRKYRENKQVQSVLPFYEISDDDLNKIFSKEVFLKSQICSVVTKLSC